MVDLSLKTKLILLQVRSSGREPKVGLSHTASTRNRTSSRCSRFQAHP